MMRVSAVSSVAFLKVFLLMYVTLVVSDAFSDSYTVKHRLQLQGDWDHNNSDLLNP